MKQNKYLYGWKLFVNYGSGWEYEVFESTFNEIRKRVKEYKENCLYPVKISRGRELNLQNNA
jgi:hypothetical protein